MTKEHFLYKWAAFFNFKNESEETKKEFENDLEKVIQARIEKNMEKVSEIIKNAKI